MFASIINPRNAIDESFETISKLLPRGPQSYYLPDYQGTISVTGTLPAFEDLETESDFFWFHYQHTDRSKIITFFSQFVANMIELQSTCEFMDNWSTSIYDSNIPAESNTQITKWLEGFNLSSKHSISDVSASLCEILINWGSTGSPERIREAIDLALEKGNHDLAAKLAAEGSQLFPADNDLQKIAKILAPPKVIQTDIPPTQGLRESMVWLKKYRSQYQDQWVAIQNGTLLGNAASREQLLESLEDSDTADTIITKLP